MQKFFVGSKVAIEFYLKGFSDLEDACEHAQQMSDGLNIHMAVVEVVNEMPKEKKK
jgi:hypothetical protein